MFKQFLASLTVLGMAACSSNSSNSVTSEQNLVGVTQFEMTSDTSWYQVMAWYPAAEKGNHTPLPYAEKWLNKALAKQYGIPSFLSGGEQLSKSWQEAPIQAGSFPVIIFNHGWQAFARSNMTQMEMLAEHGYIVMSINHPGDSVLIKRSDGTFVPQSENVKNSIKADQQLLSDIAKHYNQLKTAPSAQAYHDEIALLQQKPLYQPITQNFHQWVAQTQHLIMQVRQTDSDAIPSFLRQHIETKKIGLLGHSFGGAVSGLVAMQDKTQLPAVVLDAPQFDYGLPILNNNATILYLTGTDLKFGKTKVSNKNLNQALTKHYPNVQEINFDGASHMNFTDLNHLRPLKWMGVLGPVDNKLFWQSMGLNVWCWLKVTAS